MLVHILRSNTISFLNWPAFWITFAHCNSSPFLMRARTEFPKLEHNDLRATNSQWGCTSLLILAPTAQTSLAWFFATYRRSILYSQQTSVSPLPRDSTPGALPDVSERIRLWRYRTVVTRLGINIGVHNGFQFLEKILREELSQHTETHELLHPWYCFHARCCTKIARKRIFSASVCSLSS